MNFIRSFFKNSKMFNPLLKTFLSSRLAFGTMSNVRQSLEKLKQAFA